MQQSGSAPGFDTRSIVRDLRLIRGNKMRAILFLTLLFSATLTAQLKIETFLNEPFDNTIVGVKEKNSNKKIEESDVMIYTGLIYYDWMDPISVRVGYLFGKDGQQKGKVLSNGSGTEDDARTFFEMIKAALIKKYGTDYAESGLMGFTTLAWNHVNGYSLTLSQKKSKATFTIFCR